MRVQGCFLELKDEKGLDLVTKNPGRSLLIDSEYLQHSSFSL